MRKLLSIFILAAMLVSLTACGNNNSALTTTTPAVENGTVTATEQEPEDTSEALAADASEQVSEASQPAEMSPVSEADTTEFVSEAARPIETAPTDTADSSSSELIETTDVDTPVDISYTDETTDNELETDTDEPIVEPYTPSKDDIEVSIKEGDKISADTKRINLLYHYVGKAENAEIFFGGEYSLEKLDGEEWKPVEFAENAAFIELGYVLGSYSEIQNTEVYLGSDFYKEPLTLGKYRVVKSLGENLIYYVEFELTEAKADSDYPVENEEGSITLQIASKTDGAFVCSLPWPSPILYSVVLGEMNVYDKFCVGDMIEVGYKPMYKASENEYRLIATSIDTSNFELDENVCYKPVIYLYPTEKTDIDVKLDYNGDLTVTYPEYNDGWSVTANPDGTLYDENGDEYSYLFWEGKGEAEYDFSKGFCVKGSDTADFLRDKLSALGLTPREYNEFIVFWLPLMKDNPYNIISFQTDCYTDNAVLDVSPKPDTVIRVFMAYKAAEAFSEIKPQTLTAPERAGFTLVEWGGTEVK